jgi:hypothetical protein
VIAALRRVAGSLAEARIRATGLAGSVIGAIGTRDRGRLRWRTAAQPMAATDDQRFAMGVARRTQRFGPSIHDATRGGPRGCAPGRNDSMHTIWPCLQCGQSRSDRPVRRWYRSQ